MWHLVVFKKFAYVVLNKLKKEISKLVEYKLKYEEFCSVIRLYAASCDKTWKALTYKSYLISCCVQPKFVFTPPFSMVENPLLQFIWVNLDFELNPHFQRWHIKLSWNSKVCKFWANCNSNASAQQAY